MLEPSIPGLSGERVHQNQNTGETFWSFWNYCNTCWPGDIWVFTFHLSNQILHHEKIPLQEHYCVKIGVDTVVAFIPGLFCKEMKVQYRLPSRPKNSASHLRFKYANSNCPFIKAMLLTYILHSKRRMLKIRLGH